MKKVGLICIATGPVYHEYARGLHKSVKQYWPEADFLLFSDMDQDPGVERFFRIQPKGFPGETLYRYHTMMKNQEIFSDYAHLFYADADMLFVAPPGDIYNNTGIVATLHPGYYQKRGTPELRPASTAYFPDGLAYYAGGFQGGKSEWYWAAAQNMMHNITTDSLNNITAIWHDESHWNKYVGTADLLMPSHVKQLSPSYCYPEGYEGKWGWTTAEFPPILVALDKQARGNHPVYK